MTVRHNRFARSGRVSQSDFAHPNLFLSTFFLPVLLSLIDNQNNYLRLVVLNNNRVAVGHVMNNELVKGTRNYIFIKYCVITILRTKNRKSVLNRGLLLNSKMKRPNVGLYNRHA